MPIAAGSGDVRELLWKLVIRLVIPAPEGCPRRRLGIPDAAHLGAEMGRFEVDSDAVGLQDARKRLRDLPTHPLLDREPPGEEAHQPGQLGDAADVLMGNIANEGVAAEGKGMMLAE